MDELSRLKKIRGGHTAYLSKLMSKVHDIKDDEKALKQLEMQLKEQTETVKKFDERVLELLATDSEQEEDAFAREIEESGALREKVNLH